MSDLIVAKRSSWLGQNRLQKKSKAPFRENIGKPTAKTEKMFSTIPQKILHLIKRALKKAEREKVKISKKEKCMDPVKYACSTEDNRRNGKTA